MERLEGKEDEENKGEVENIKRRIREMQEKYGDLSYKSKEMNFKLS